MRTTVCVLLTATVVTVAVRAADWPQWRGADRIGVAEESVKGEWPEGGPKELWRVTLGAGYSSPSAVGDRLYVTGNAKAGDTLRGFLYALEATSGKEIWKLDYGPEWGASYPEARTAPTVVGDRIFLVSGMMDVVCASTDGKPVWRVNLIERFGGKNLRWGFAESPLVYDGKIICHPGGPDATVAALDAKTGETLWISKGLSDAATYCSPMLLTLHGVRQVVTHTGGHLAGLDADSGAVLWKTPYRNDRGIQPNTPLLIGTDRLAVGCGYKHGTHLFRVSKDAGGAFSAAQVWENKDADNQFYGLILHEGVLFSAATKGKLHAIDPETGKTLYRVEEAESASLVKTPARLIAYSQKDGTVFLLEADAAKYAVKGSFRVTYGEGPHWAHPVVANGTLYIRHGAVLAAYQVGK
ncbi:MAG: PQQ-binding-like beta-propeller repeat protein [Kiritimatiellaeota bacterium]|nr:PQQ-binding-like beta-propeller repeat protein [Kiritimatiellota bacterium]